MLEADRSIESEAEPPLALAAKIYGMVLSPSLSDMGERTLLGGHLSRASQFRLIVTGEVGKDEIDHLISHLNLLRAVLGESGDDYQPTPRQIYEATR